VLRDSRRAKTPNNVRGYQDLINSKLTKSGYLGAKRMSRSKSPFAKNCESGSCKNQINDLKRQKLGNVEMGESWTETLSRLDANHFKLKKEYYVGK